MPGRFDRAALVAIPLVPIAIFVAVGLFLMATRCNESHQPTPDLMAEATLESPSGDRVGTVTFRQTSSGVLVMAELNGISPGGHAVIVHEVGACAPDFSAAGDHFNPEDTEHGFVHPAWRRGSATRGHGGDLPNIYAASDGSARADFFTVGFTLDPGPRHSVFDADGSAIIVHEKPDAYGEEESDTGDRIACGIIRPA